MFLPTSSLYSRPPYLPVPLYLISFCSSPPHLHVHILIIFLFLSSDLFMFLQASNLFSDPSHLPVSFHLTSCGIHLPVPASANLTFAFRSILSSCFFPSSCGIHLPVPAHVIFICRYQNIILPPHNPVPVFSLFPFLFLSTVFCSTLTRPYFPALLALCLFPNGLPFPALGCSTFPTGFCVLNMNN